MSDIGGIISGAYGSVQGKVGTTIETFAISLAGGFVLFGAQFGTFLIVRNYLWAKRIYQPRSFLLPVKDRVKPPPNNPFRWIATVFKTPAETEVLQKAGMDAYFFLRYLAMCLKIFFPSALVILPILISINATNGKNTNVINGVKYNVTGLDLMSWSNVSPEHTNRYWAHLILAVGVVAWVCFLFHEELMHYVVKRQEYLCSPSHRLKASSTTVLITDIPKELCTNEALTEMYDEFPHGLRRIWLNRNYQAIVDKDKLRKRFENRLENAETNLIRRVVRRAGHAKHKEQKKAKEQDTVNTVRENKTTSLVPIDGPATAAACEKDLQYDLESKAAWTEYITPQQRQTMQIANPENAGACKIPILGRFFRTRVDTIYYCRRELARLNKEIDADIEESDSCPQNGSAFIQFNSQKAAHLACQAVAGSLPRQMVQRTVEISPADINWSSLNYSWQNRASRLVLFFALFILALFVFGLISFFTGILSRVSSLSGSTTWLHWIGDLPSWLLAFLQGTVPPVLLVVLLSGPTPIVLRAMTNSTRGATTGSQGERSLQLWYFIFLLFEVFIIPTLASGLTSIVDALIKSPTSVPEILVTNLPTAANYYFSFLVVQALSISASSILQTIRLLNFYVFGSANTPDAVFSKLSFTWRTRIGSNIPWYTTFCVIGIVYACIAPLILVFMLITFSLFYLVIKNNLIWVVRTGNVDGGGLWFPSAISQTFTGLYFMEASLIFLFFLVRDVHGETACVAQGIIMAVVMGGTVFYQIWLAINFNGLFEYAPLRLEREAVQRDREYEMERLNPPTQEHRPASESTIEEQTLAINTASKVDALREDHDAAPSDLERPPEHFLNYERRSSTLRSSEMLAKQNHDKARAKNILARLNRPLNERRLAALEDTLIAAEARVGNVLIPKRRDVEAQMMNDPISKIIMQHNDELEDLDVEERDMLISVAFTHPVLRETRPSVWIPRDDVGVSDDEVARTRALSVDVVIENRGAFFNRKLKVEVDKPPPDMSEFALVMAEL